MTTESASTKRKPATNVVRQTHRDAQALRTAGRRARAEAPPPPLSNGTGRGSAPARSERSAVPADSALFWTQNLTASRPVRETIPLWGGPPGPRPTPPSASLLIAIAKSTLESPTRTSAPGSYRELPLQDAPATLVLGTRTA
jgi:hypothetical protein